MQRILQKLHVAVIRNDGMTHAATQRDATGSYWAGWVVGLTWPITAALVGALPVCGSALGLW